MSKKRQKSSELFKAKVALESLKTNKTLSQLSSEYKINGNMISKWKTQLISGAAEIFRKGSSNQESSNEVLISELYQQIGEMKVQLDWLKKKSSYFG